MPYPFQKEKHFRKLFFDDDVDPDILDRLELESWRSQRTADQCPGKIPAEDLAGSVGVDALLRGQRLFPFCRVDRVGLVKIAALDDDAVAAAMKSGLDCVFHVVLLF